MPPNRSARRDDDDDYDDDDRPRRPKKKKKAAKSSNAALIAIPVVVVGLLVAGGLVGAAWWFTKSDETAKINPDQTRPPDLPKLQPAGGPGQPKVNVPPVQTKTNVAPGLPKAVTPAAVTPSGKSGLEVGDTALEIDGEDIDGKKFKLSDYRGKVVVLDFWGHW